MQIIELKTQYKLFMITSKFKNGPRNLKNQKDQEAFLTKMVDSGQAVNPFLTNLYF